MYYSIRYDEKYRAIYSDAKYLSRIIEFLKLNDLLNNKNTKSKEILKILFNKFNINTKFIE